MKRMTFLAALGLLPLLSGCATSPPVNFFTLDTVEAQQQPSQASGAPVQIASVHIPPALDRQEMVRESAPNELEMSDRNRWGAPLGQMIRRVLTQDLAKRLPSGRVVLPQEPPPSETNDIVVDILQFDSDASGKVVFDGSWSLLEAGSGTALLDRQVHLTERAAPKDYGSQAKAMSRILGRLADDIAAALAAQGAAKGN